MNRVEPARAAAGHAAILFVFLTGPLAWGIHEGTVEVLLSSACSYGLDGFAHFRVAGILGWQLVLLVVTAFFLALVLLADITAVVIWRRSRLGTSETGQVGGALGRTGWMALAGILLNTLFLAGIVATGAPIFWLSGCA